MPLSEHEQRLLEQMERALYAEDPKFATSMRNSRAAAGDKRRIAIGVVGFLAGMGLLVAGVATQLVIVGVLGFLSMLGGIWLATTALTGSTRPVAGTPTDPSGHSATQPRVRRPSSPKARRSGESLSERMEQRWRRRREKGDF